MEMATLRTVRVVSVSPALVVVVVPRIMESGRVLESGRVPETQATTADALKMDTCHVRESTLTTLTEHLK